MEYRTLGKTSLHVSVLGFGASPLGDVFDRTDEPEGLRAVHTALDGGVNFFDVSPFYGDTLAETRLGKALDGKRKDVLISTKGGRYGGGVFDFSGKRILSSLEESLKRLRTDYVDLYLIHDIEFGDREQVLNEAIPAALALKEQGKARYVGFSGLPVRYLAQVARQTAVDAVLSWGHYTLLNDEINDELVPLSHERGFGLLNAAPLMQRILSDEPIPAWQNSPQAVKDLQPRLRQLCGAYGVALSAVALRFALDHPAIATTIVGMNDPRQVAQNLDVLNFGIPEGLLDEIHALVAPVKNQMWYEGKPENNIRKTNLVNE